MTGERVETAGEYTPTTKDVRAAYAMADEAWGGCLGRSPATLRAEFDRWVAQVRADAYAQGGRDALTAAAEEIDVAHVARGDYRVPPDYRPQFGAHIQWLDFDTTPPTMHAIGLADWLRTRAAQTGADSLAASRAAMAAHTATPAGGAYQTGADR